MWVGDGRKQTNFSGGVKNTTVSLNLILACFSSIVSCPSTNLYEANGSRNSTRVHFFTLLSRVVARRGLREDFSLLDLFWLEDREPEAESKECSMYPPLQKEKAPGIESLTLSFLGLSSSLFQQADFNNQEQGSKCLKQWPYLKRDNNA